MQLIVSISVGQLSSYALGMHNIDSLVSRFIFPSIVLLSLLTSEHSSKGTKRTRGESSRSSAGKCKHEKCQSVFSIKFIFKEY